MGGPTAARLRPRTILPAYSQVAHQLREHVLSGLLAPGDQLPIEPDLAELFGVSRSTVREALRQLASEGLVRTARGVRGGTFVAHPSSDAISVYLATGLGLLAGAEQISVANLLATRSALEEAAAALTAGRRTEQDLHRIQEALAPKRIDGASRLDANRRFHALLLATSANNLLEVLAQPICQVMTARLDADDVAAASWRQAEADHTAIYEAIAAGEPDAASARMREHLQRIQPSELRSGAASREGSIC